MTRKKKSSKRLPSAVSRHDDKVVIGWLESVDFVEWGIRILSAKVDTGARTSALHVEDMEFLPDDYASFDVVLSRRDAGRRKRIVAKICRWGKVRSSNGDYSFRCFVRTYIRIGTVEKEIELSLVSREKMTYRMLLGREALEKDFVIDVGRRKKASAPVKRRTNR